jgi:hypothetical protein
MEDSCICATAIDFESLPPPSQVTFMLNFNLNRVLPAVLSLGLLTLAVRSGEAQTAPDPQVVLGSQAAPDSAQPAPDPPAALDASQTAPDPQTSSGSASRSAVTGVQPAYVPMSASDRWHHYLLGLVSPVAIFRSAAASGITQWNDTPHEWGQGSTGYGRRFASSFGGHIVRQTIQSGAGALLDEDNRYVRCTESGFTPRLKYAVTSTFMARSHTGARKVSYSAIGSLVGAAIISRAWQPPSTSHASNAATALATTAGASVGFHVAREFLPKFLHGWW